MVAKTMKTEKTPVLAKKARRRTPKPGKLRPSKTQNRNLRHGVESLDRLLRADLDGRLHVARKRDLLESQLIDEAGGLPLTPSLLLIIKRIVTKALVCDQSEKMALLNEYTLSDKRYIALSNSLRRDLVTFESMLRQRKPKVTKSLDQYLDETYRTDDK
jgi:hypothetical protein